MILGPSMPSTGTVGDWLDAQASSDDVAIVFPETREEVTWTTLHNEASEHSGGRLDHSHLV
ncbi:hypothetical protein [Litoreibacter roseus]|uniref:Uncharacterized protein n=1 Tax=Litoreibacter roseus TaxID=2601869 RepID=A0A6N6JHL7_9RHOB|nr:hypothetical protein [Litoreibacter roseus]GFE65330.1 hypothetical protein KIN_24040 [Litoreibacter roseus]